MLWFAITPLPALEPSHHGPVTHRDGALMRMRDTTEHFRDAGTKTMLELLEDCKQAMGVRTIGGWPSPARCKARRCSAVSVREYYCRSIWRTGFRLRNCAASSCTAGPSEAGRPLAQLAGRSPAGFTGSTSSGGRLHACAPTATLPDAGAPPHAGRRQ